MIGWFSRMLGRAERRAAPRAVDLPPLPPLPTTAVELATTNATHHATLRKADRVLTDFERMDGALRVVVVKRVKPR